MGGGEGGAGGHALGPFKVISGGAGGGGGESGHGKGAWGWGGRAERAGMHWGPFKSSDRGMGPRGHGKGAWRGRVCGWWQPCETWGHELKPLKECQNIREVWVVGAMWDHGAMSHGWHGGHAMDMGRVHGGGGGGGQRRKRSGRACTGDRGMGPRGHGKRAWGVGVCGWWQPCGILKP